MDAYEQKIALESFVILRDTREQDTPRARARYASFGVPCDRATLSYGDYTYNAQLPDGSWVCDTAQTISPACFVERKMNLDELAQCFTRGRERFQKEFERAQANKAKGFLLIENASWENLIAGRYRSKFNPKAFLASAAAWAVRYDLNLIFCKEETSGKLIKELLYRDFKERLERGIYDQGNNRGAGEGRNNTALGV